MNKYFFSALIGCEVIQRDKYVSNTENISEYTAFLSLRFEF